MDEKQLISKIRQLRQIKPRKDWVVFAKNEILGEEPTYRERVSVILEIFPRVIFQKRLAYAFLVVLVVLVGTFGFAQNTVPGDLLFSLKKVTEESQKVFISGENQSKYNLEIVNKRLEDLNKVVQNNQKKNIAPTIKEVEASLSQVAKGLIKEGAQKGPEAIKEIVLQVKKLKEQEQNIKSLGMELEETEELDNPLVSLVQKEIESLEKASLNEVQQTLLDWAKIDVENKDYSEALIKILQISNQ